MKKIIISKVINDVLTKGNKQDLKIISIYLTAKNEIKNKNRICYCFKSTGQSFDQFKLEVNRFAGADFEINFQEFNNSQNMIDFFSSASYDSSSTDNNWRGRLFSLDEFEGRAVNERESFLLKSTWRIIVQRGPSGDFFVRRDIYPYIWSNGHSVGGIETFVENMKSELDILIKKRSVFVDSTYDDIKVIAKKETQGSTFPVNMSAPQSAKYDCKIDYLEDNYNEIINNLMINLTNYFNS